MVEFTFRYEAQRNSGQVEHLVVDLLRTFPPSALVIGDLAAALASGYAGSLLE